MDKSEKTHSRISDKVKIEDERDQDNGQQEQSKQHREQKQSLPTNAPVPKVPQIEVSNRAGANQLTRHPLMGFGSSIPMNDLMLLRAAEKVAQIRGTEPRDKDQEPSAHLQPAALSSTELFEQEYRRRQHLQLLDLRFQRQMEVVQKIEELQNQAMQQRNPSETPRIRQTALSRRRTRDAAEDAEELAELEAIKRRRVQNTNDPEAMGTLDASQLTCKKGVKTVVLTEEARKIQHRLVERKRTRKINSLMEGLRNQVQDAGMYLRKVDKASVLSAAITCIKLLRAQRKELNAMLEIKHHGFALPQRSAPHRVPLTRGHVPGAVRWSHQQMHMPQRDEFMQPSMPRLSDDPPID